MNESVHSLTLSALFPLIKDKQISPAWLTEQTLRRIESLEPGLRAFIRVLPEEAMEQARTLEAEAVQGRIRGPLHGIPVAVKDVLQTGGIPTTAGSKVLEHWIPDRDATAVARLKQAGAIVIGKANLHEFAMGATTENPHYGTTRNPWDRDKIAGGSSGGSAAALAAGMCFGALGTDTAGSIRLPSALCGTVGLKPTYGAVSRFGCVPFSWSLDHVGPMARTVEDTAILFESISGFDPKDAASSRRPLAPGPIEKREDLKGFTLGLCREYFFEGMHPEIAGIVDRAMERLQSLGAEIREISLSRLSEAQGAARIIAQSEGYSFHKPMLQHASGQYSEDVRFRLEFGRQVSADDYLQAQKFRRKFIADTAAAMASVDALISPMNHNPPFPIGSVSPEQAIHNMFRLAKAPLANFLGFPALSVPCGFVEDRLPVGLQLIGKPFDDCKLLLIGDVYERSESWSERLARHIAELL
ncbi:Asp-tRNA(Asn)/Glu-tRNA(Gln) amidotransferase subunit GatA [Paenibacillus sp. 7124]|uniref:Asp-tRNA(Asn)/Glu-tRNA(Gln) amidotransferase subunit GatA n=1 Tax=Paenibacillus apii TaxID=1850370 RepID=A0A6M1PN69_9BACL|nr:amidase [Paenibacillus apii]NGM83918.1 Asp-tRNA(Asn)/Glu-tRNA(Gln) amidotransferase subunit GatA [Paenibacillus apii]NJJ40564.1 Asp-tRNA(Asn)/Glu-tRNA(Gln) amidotransferase subunit GatA [Paenibacillus apii]